MPYGSAFVSVCFLKNSPLPTKTLDLRQAGPQLPRDERSEKSGRSIMSPSNPRSAENNGGGGGGGGKNYIEHQVSKMDTLAGVAIKYGVEVCDIKRMNGFATDLQMFALNTLKIPLPGRHPPSIPSPTTSTATRENDTQKSTPCLGLSIGSKPPKENKVTTAMSTLQKYYGLRSPNLKGKAQGMEMAVYRSRSSESFDQSAISPLSDPLSHPNKSRHSSIDLLSENGAMADYLGDGQGEKFDDKSVRRRQKAEVDNGAVTPERLLKGEYSGGTSTGNGLAMRQKSSSRPSLQSDSDSGWLNSVPVGMGDSITIMADDMAVVRKSSSTPSLKDQDSNNTVSIWPTSRWSLTQDLQALSTATMARPIFDGLPKPITGRWKTALD
ncbi:hypothetical protein D8674_030043 [Pyrus ussuriensis x Pyrus communis]|uniref:LysM domain-containing protein n=1 Tax=Pyrus ussuriensis x Pyrus communis TaxID=2448454 RepID=A0A5N5I0T6_9ROSA|nr:hypothetical protein D8674_030043 [Pyrus ussuriensis x Pyrus communis]